MIIKLSYKKQKNRDSLPELRSSLVEASSIEVAEKLLVDFLLATEGPSYDFKFVARTITNSFEHIIPSVKYYQLRNPHGKNTHRPSLHSDSQVRDFDEVVDFE